MWNLWKYGFEKCVFEEIAMPWPCYRVSRKLERQFKQKLSGTETVCNAIFGYFLLGNQPKSLSECQLLLSLLASSSLLMCLCSELHDGDVQVVCRNNEFWISAVDGNLFHALAAFISGKETTVASKYDPGWTTELFRTLKWQKILPLPRENV